ncbi:site-specific integrase [Christensenellaceae bacterium OttesenSCG-928-K19]|nr:site-specific integrase [Christensenellaceae bacterium OttesenSCG-928-K19]
MTGSLQKKSNKYYVVLNLYDEEGKRIPKWIPTDILVESGSKRTDKENKTKAAQYLTDMLRKYDNTVWSEMLFADFLYNWIEYKKNARRKIESESIDDYEGYIRRHIDPFFRKRGTKVCDMDAEAIEDFYTHMEQKGQTGNSILHYRIPIKGALELAVRKHFLHSNPTMQAEAPEKEKPPFDYFSLSELESFLDEIRGVEFLYPLIQLTADYGVRRSEVLGLKWSAIDFENDAFEIRHTVRQVKKLRGKDKTKTEKSKRSFPLTASIKRMLLELKEKEEKNREQFGESYIENKYVFKWEDGRLIRPDYVTSVWIKLMKKHSPSHQITFHQLRHSCASNLIKLGFSLAEICEWLGHSSIQITKDVYGHLDFEHKKRMALALERKTLESDQKTAHGESRQDNSPLQKGAKNIISFAGRKQARMEPEFAR